MCPEARLTIAAGMKNGEMRPGPPCSSLECFAFDDVESADAAGYVDAGHFRDVRSNLQIRHAHGEVGRRQGDLNESPHFLEFFFGDPVQRIKVANFAGNRAIKRRWYRIE